MKKLISIIALSCAAAATSAQRPSDGRGFFFSVERLAGMCASDDAGAVGVCHGFILGVIDAGNSVHFCLPHDRKAGAYIEPVLRMVAASPESYAPLPANEMIIAALAGSFPCQQRNAPEGRHGWRSA